MVRRMPWDHIVY